MTFWNKKKRKKEIPSIYGVGVNSNETNIETGKKSLKKRKEKKNVQNIKLENKFQIPDVWKKDPYSYIYLKNVVLAET